MNIESMVDTTLLRRIFVVMRLTHCVAVGNSYDILSLSMVLRKRWVSAMLGLVDTKIRPYVTLLSAWTSDW